MRCLVLSFILIACDSPGGKDARCGADPSPACQGDAAVAPDASAPSDSDSAGDGGGDSAGADDSQAPSDVVLPDTTGPVECIGSLTRCGQDLVEQCIEGHWVATTQCTGNDICVNGACVTQECIEGVRCSDGSRQACVDHHWQEVERCDFACDGAACATHGEADCAALFLDCAAETDCDLAPDSECTKACARRGSVAAQTTFDALVGCYDNPSWATAVNDCVPLKAECLAPTPGGGSCDNLHGCLFSCPSGNDDCALECYGAATREATVRVLRYLQCQSCQDFDCLQTCGDYLDICP
ncbi:MAG: hypothetical protein U1F43_31965 [Myxococcota bacterium]